MSLKVYYFDGRGVAEPTRWILSYGGEQFEDIRAPIPKVRVPGKMLPEEIRKSKSELLNTQLLTNYSFE